MKTLCSPTSHCTASKSLRWGVEDGCEPDRCKIDGVSRLTSHSVQDFFKVWDVLVFVEAAIYEMDEENEALALAGSEAPEVTFQGMPFS